MSACLPLPFINFRVSVVILLNEDKMYCLKVLFLSLAISLSQPDLYMAIMNSQATKLNSTIWEILLTVLLPNGYCLINDTILCKKHMMFFASLNRKSLILNKKIEVKLSSYNCKLASWLAWYRITKSSKFEMENM